MLLIVEQQDSHQKEKTGGNRHKTQVGYISLLFNPYHCFQVVFNKFMVLHFLIYLTKIIIISTYP